LNKFKSKGILFKAKSVWKNASEELRLKKRVWRRAPEARSSEAIVIRSISRQKLLHQS